MVSHFHSLIPLLFLLSLLLFTILSLSNLPLCSISHFQGYLNYRTSTCRTPQTQKSRGVNPRDRHVSTLWRGLPNPNFPCQTHFPMLDDCLLFLGFLRPAVRNDVCIPCGCCVLSDVIHWNVGSSREVPVPLSLRDLARPLCRSIVTR